MPQNTKISVSGFYRFCKKKLGDGKKPLKTVITNFYKLHMNKGKEYTFKNFKKFGIHNATIYRRMKKIEENGKRD